MFMIFLRYVCDVFIFIVCLYHVMQSAGTGVMLYVYYNSHDNNNIIFTCENLTLFTYLLIFICHCFVYKQMHFPHHFLPLPSPSHLSPSSTQFFSPPLIITKPFKVISNDNINSGGDFTCDIVVWISTEYFKIWNYDYLHRLFNRLFFRDIILYCYIS